MTCGQASQATNVRLVQQGGWTSIKLVQMDTIWTPDGHHLDQLKGSHKLVERPALPSPAHAELLNIKLVKRLTWG